MGTSPSCFLASWRPGVPVDLFPVGPVVYDISASMLHSTAALTAIQDAVDELLFVEHHKLPSAKRALFRADPPSRQPTNPPCAPYRSSKCSPYSVEIGCVACHPPRLYIVGLRKRAMAAGSRHVIYSSLIISPHTQYHSVTGAMPRTRRPFMLSLRRHVGQIRRQGWQRDWGLSA